MEQQQKTMTVRWALVIGVVAIGLFLVTAYIVRERLESFTTTTQVLLAEQQALLLTIAETTARNGADSVTEAIVQDCPVDDRTRFDTLLGRLDSGLSQAQLVELEQLFGVCGGFFAERKAVMVARLTREIEVYETYVTQLSTLTGKPLSSHDQLTHWRGLAEGEQTQSVLFSDLVRSQKEIIDALLLGETPNSETITTILNDVRETREALLLAKTQTDELRRQLTAL